MNPYTTPQSEVAGGVEPPPQKPASAPVPASSPREVAAPSAPAAPPAQDNYTEEQRRALDMFGIADVPPEWLHPEDAVVVYGTGPDPFTFENVRPGMAYYRQTDAQVAADMIAKGWRPATGVRMKGCHTQGEQILCMPKALHDKHVLAKFNHFRSMHDPEQTKARVRGAMGQLPEEAELKFNAVGSRGMTAR